MDLQINISKAISRPRKSDFGRMVALAQIHSLAMGPGNAINQSNHWKLICHFDLKEINHMNTTLKYQVIVALIGIALGVGAAIAIFWL